MVPYKCLTSPQKTVSALRPPQHEPTRWDKQEAIKTRYQKKKQNIYPLKHHYIQHQQSIPTIQGTWATISVMTPIYKQDVKTSQHKQWQKIQIKVSFFFYFNLCNYSILPLMLTSSNFLTFQIYHCGLSILIHKGKSTKPRRMASLKATATQAFCRVQPLTPPKPTSY